MCNWPLRLAKKKWQKIFMVEFLGFRKLKNQRCLNKEVVFGLKLVMYGCILVLKKILYLRKRLALRWKWNNWRHYERIKRIKVSKRLLIIAYLGLIAFMLMIHLEIELNF